MGGTGGHDGGRDWRARQRWWWWSGGGGGARKQRFTIHLVANLHPFESTKTNIKGGVDAPGDDKKVCVGTACKGGACEKDVSLLWTDTGRGRRRLTERKNINKRRERRKENRPVMIVQGWGSGGGFVGRAGAEEQ